MSVFPESQRDAQLGFPAEKSDGPVDVLHRFGRFAKKAELEDFRFHDLRHSAASTMARAGVPERQMQEVLGHKIVAMIIRYTHLRPSELDGAWVRRLIQCSYALRTVVTWLKRWLGNLV